MSGLSDVLDMRRVWRRKEDGFLIMKNLETETDQLLLTDGGFAETRNTDLSWEYLQRKEWEEKVESRQNPVSKEEMETVESFIDIDCVVKVPKH